MPTINISSDAISDHFSDHANIDIESFIFVNGDIRDVTYDVNMNEDMKYDLDSSEVLSVLPEIEWDEDALMMLSDVMVDNAEGNEGICINLIQKLLTDMDNEQLLQVYDSIKFRVPQVEKKSFMKRLFG